MTAHIGHPTLRLIRYAIGAYTIDDINNGEFNFNKGEIRNIETNLTDPITTFETYSIRFQFKNKRKHRRKNKYYY